MYICIHAHLCIIICIYVHICNCYICIRINIYICTHICMYIYAINVIIFCVFFLSHRSVKEDEGLWDGHGQNAYSSVSEVKPLHRHQPPPESYQLQFAIQQLQQQKLQGRLFLDQSHYRTQVFWFYFFVLIVFLDMVLCTYGL